MVKMVLQGGRYYKSLKASVEASIGDLSKRLEAAAGDRKKLASLREELGNIGKKISGEPTYNNLCLASMQLGAMEREITMLDFFGKKAD